MRFSRLRIPAYGPFTDFELELPKAGADLHVIYGPNEAGKSSLLRAIRALLFGIHAQTSDGFLHDYNRMRIAAELGFPDGSLRTFQRRKGNKNTLLDAENQVIPESELTVCLGAVDADYFDSMFGLDSARLRTGSAELLRGQGRLGDALFSASMGGTPVDLVIRDLEAEAAEIFSGRAQKRLRRSGGLLTEYQRKMKEALVKPEDWDEAERKLSEVMERLASLESQRGELSNRKAWLERCLDALVMVGKLREHEAELGKLPNIDGLPESFAGDLRTARADSLAREAEVRRLTSELARIRQQMSECSPSAPLLEQAAVIDHIHAHLGAYGNDKTSLARKQGEAATALDSIARMCKDLGITESFENLEPLRITQIQFAEAGDWAEKVATTTEQVVRAEARLEELTRNVSEREAANTDVDEERLATLKALGRQATQMQDKAEALAERRNTLARLKTNLAELHRELSGAPADHQQTWDLPVPSKATLERFRLRWEESERDLRTASDGVRQLRQQADDLRAEIEGLIRLRDIPDLEKLKEARAHRDHGWALVLADWKGAGAKEELQPGKPLEQAYPDAVSAADQVADRLRSEANAVAQVEEKRLNLERQKQKLVEEEARRTALQEQAEAMKQEWEEAWAACAIMPQSPAEMLAWRVTWQDFRRVWKDHEAQRAVLEEDTKAVETLTVAMAGLMSSTGSSFASLQGQIAEDLESIEAAKVDALASRKISEQEKVEIAHIEANLGALRSAQEAAREGWRQLADALSISTDLSPTRAIELLSGRRDVFREVDRCNALAGECSLLQKSIDEFAQEVRQTAATAGLGDAGIESLAQTLWSDLQTAREAKKRLEVLAQNETELDSQLKVSKAQFDDAEGAFARHCRTANLEDASGVDAFVANFEEVQKHRQSIGGLRESLAGLARGEAVDAFVQRVSQEDASGIEGELARLAQESSDLNLQEEAARNEKQLITTRKAELERAGDEAARSAQLGQFEESRMLADARRFIELQMALTLLKGQINQFRERNQGPFLTKASHWFSELTGGAFESIISSFVSGDEPTIAGRRKDESFGQEVTVEGMSEGTRDQLYLALRLAGLELHLSEHNPMPLILDDLLVHFDDQRACHALKALALMAEKCQILLFTHHQHILDLAKSTLEKNVFSIHPLP